MIDIDKLPGSDVDEPVYRVILSRYPQIDLFERVSNPQDWEVLYAVESLTNPRLRDEVGDIRLVAPEGRVYGDGASWIMAAFTHPPVDGRGGRFNRDFGICYCATDEAVAIAESSFYRARFRSVAKCYPMKDKAEILADLIATTSGQEGKWFATAKDIQLYDLALELVSMSPCEPKTLTRAEREYVDKEPEFALGSAMVALRWLCEGWG